MANALCKQSVSFIRKLAVVMGCLLAVFSANAQAPPNYSPPTTCAANVSGDIQLNSVAGLDLLGTYNGHTYYITQDFHYGTGIAAKVSALSALFPGQQVYAAAILNRAENDWIACHVLAYNQIKYGAVAPPVASSVLYQNPTPGAKSKFENWGDVRNPWIGYTDNQGISSEGSFVWSNGQPNCQNFENWNVREPNNYTGTDPNISNGEDYAQMLIMEPYTYNYPAGSPMPNESFQNDPLGRWNDWFNDAIKDFFNPQLELGDTKLPIIIEVGPRECIPLNFSLTGKTNVNCYGGSDGSATFTISAGQAPFTYKLDGGEETDITTNPFTVSGLDAGNYEIEVKDANGNTQTLNFTITQPVSLVDASASLLTHVKCNEGSDGSVTISATGGTPAYTVQRDGEATSYATPHNFTGLTAGVHTFTVTDANGCTDEVTVTITEPEKLELEAEVENPPCNGTKGSAVITATGGTAPYTGTGVKPNLAPGNHTFTVTDANGCSATITVTILPPAGGGFNVQAETFPNKFNTWLIRSLSNATFTGSTGTWSVSSNSYATMMVTTPYYSPSSSYALKVVNFKTQGCGAGWTKATSPKLDLTGPCCPDDLKLNFTLWTYNVVNGDTKAKLEVDFSADNGATWNEVWSKTSNDLYDTYGDNGKTVIKIPVPTSYHTSNFRYRIRGEMASNDYNNFYVFIDDINFTSPPSCAPLGSIGNFVWKDVNGNGKQDPGEPGLSNVSVKLTRPDATSITTTTDASGNYNFGGLAAGNYTVTFITPSGLEPTLANQGANDGIDSDPVSGVVSVSLAAGQHNNTIDAGFKVPACTNTTNHLETFPNKFNTNFYTSLYNKTFTGSSGTWTLNSDDRATMVVTKPYYSPSTSYALKVVHYKTSGCGSTWSKAVSPKINLSNPCCPSQLKLNFTLWTYKVTNGDSKAKLEIDFSSNNGATWQEVWSKTSNELYDTYGANGKTTITIPVPVGYQNSNFRYRIRGEMASGDYNNFYLFIDDIKIGSPAACNTSAPMTNGRTMGGSNSSSDKGAAMGETSRSKDPVEAIEDVKINFAVNVFPNPTNAEYELRVSSKENTPVSVRVVDMLGRIVHSVRTSSNQSIRFGAEFKSGSYLVEVTQGERTEVIKLIKL